MRNTIANRLWSCLAVSLLLGTATFAQSPVPASYKPADPRLPDVSTMMVERPRISAVVTTNVQHSFDQVFEGVKAPFWVTGHKRSVAQFRLGDRLALASFDNRGTLDYTILSGSAAYLPDFEKSLLHTYYYGYDILSAQEVTTRDQKVWVVLVQNKKELCRLRLADGEVDLMQRYKRLD